MNQLTRNKIKAPNFDLLAFVGIFSYYMTMVLFSYQESMTIYAKISAVFLGFYFIAKLFIGDKNRLIISREYKILMAWFFWAILSSFFAVNQFMSLVKALTLLQVMGVSFIIFNFTVWQGRSSGFWFSVIIIALAASGFVFLSPQKFIGMDGRMHGTVGNANLFSVLLLAAMISSLVFVYSAKNIMVKVFSFAATVFLFYMVLETGSRKGMFGALFVSMYALFILSIRTYKSSKAKYLMSLVIAFLVMSLAVFFVMNGKHAHRIEGLVTAYQEGDASAADRSLEGRYELYKIATNEALKRPLFGVGLDNFRNINTGGYFGSSVGAYSHSNYMEVMVSTGIIGLLLYVSIYIVMLSRLYRLRRAVYYSDIVGDYAITSSLFIMIIIFDFAMVSFSEKVSWFLLAGIMAQIYIIENKLRLHTKKR